MLTSIHLAGFKAFVDAPRGDITLRPITLVFGPNSSGKSTILQALLGLAQSMGPQVPERLICHGRFVDLGSFANARNAQQPTDGPIMLGLAGRTKEGVRLWFGPPDGRLTRVDVSIAGTWWPCEVRSDETGMSLFPTMEGFSHLTDLGPEGQAVVALLTSEEAPVRARVSLTESGWFDEFVQDDVIDSDSQELLEHSRSTRLPSDPERQSSTLPGRKRRSVRFELPERPLGAALVGLMSSRLAELQVLKGSLFPIGPSRVHGLRSERVDYSSRDIWVGLDGSRVLQVLHDHRGLHVLERVNRWLEMLENPYVVSLAEMPGAVARMVELQLRREGPSRHVVGLPDVGFGVGQILPMLVQFAVLDEGIVTVEQPEIHLHPQMQAELGRVIADWIKPVEGEVPGNRQIIVETHSEHLVLGIQSLVRAGQLDPGLVQILVIDGSPKSGKRGPAIRAIDLHADGELRGVWPGGFFPERDRLLRRGGRK